MKPQFWNLPGRIRWRRAERQAKALVALRLLQLQTQENTEVIASDVLARWDAITQRQAEIATRLSAVQTQNQAIVAGLASLSERMRRLEGQRQTVDA